MCKNNEEFVFMLSRFTLDLHRTKGLDAVRSTGNLPSVYNSATKHARGRAPQRCDDNIYG